jgi:hypothetical protein
MSLSFQPMSEEEVLNLLKPGIYKFEVRGAEDAVSKKGNPMIKLSLVTWDEKGRERYVTDYLMAAMMYKIKHFCDATGLDDKYLSGSFNAQDCIGKTGQFKLRIEESDGYAPKNSVQDYIKALKVVKEEVPFDDSEDLPF